MTSALDPDHRGAGTGRFVDGADRPALLHHGTTATRARAIAREGLCGAGIERTRQMLGATSGGERFLRDHIFLTDDPAVARHYAEHRVTEEAVSVLDAGRTLEGVNMAAAVVRVRLPATHRLMLQRSLVLASLPWMTHLPESSSEYVTDCAIAPRDIDGIEEWRVDQLDDPQALRQFRRDSARLDATFFDPDEPEWPKARHGRLARAMVCLGRLLGAARREIPLFDEAHARAVAAAGVRIIDVDVSSPEEPPEVDPAVVLAFALLHNGHRPGAGLEHEELHEAVVERLAGEYLRFSEAQRDQFSAALVVHGWPVTPPEPTIAACLDADRLARGHRPSEMATPHARTLAANPERVPRAEDCNWDWIWERYHVLAGPRVVAADELLDRLRDIAAPPRPTLRLLGFI